MLPLVVAATLGLTAAWRLPIVDDEANAIELALAGMGPALEAGLGQRGHFHPPLNDLLQSAFLSFIQPPPLWLARMPALLWWLAACALLPWALAPILTPRERAFARWAVVLFPVHWTLPFVATWYSLAAFLGLLATGAVLHAFSNQSSPALLTVWAGAMIALGYTVFAWPAVLLGQALLVTRLWGFGALREHARGLTLALVGVGAGLAPTLLTVARRLPFAARGEAGGGGWNFAGALLALATGSTALAVPASLLGAAGLSLVTGTVLLRRASRQARALFAAGALVMTVLLVTRTLADKRLLLCSVYLVAALGAGASQISRRVVLGCFAALALPALLGILGVTDAPLTFPRWQDPHPQLARSHCEAAQPRFLVADHPALVLTVNALCGSLPSSTNLEAVTWQTDTDSLLRNVERARGGGAEVTVDLVAFLERPGGWLAAAVAALESRGFAVTTDQHLARDELPALRGAGARPDTRFHWVRLTMTGQRQAPH